MKLTDEQLHAAGHGLGHARIIAVAGAGKTSTLTHYIENRLTMGIDPRRMLVLMYNRAARDEFSERLNHLCKGHHSSLPEVRTFHSLGLKIYKKLVASGHLSQVNFKPLSDTKVELVLKELLLKLAPKNVRSEVKDRIQLWLENAASFIDIIKCDIHSPEVVFDQLALPAKCKFFIDVYHGFEEWRKDNHRITFNDMIFDPAVLLHKKPPLAEKFSNAMDEILVDEYQDINAIQHSFLRMIGGHRANVVVIGDPDQTIYEFRGSSPDFILSGFERDFGAAKTYKLSRTFRYGHKLALAANHLISQNSGREDILCISSEDAPLTRVRLAEVANYGPKVAQAITELYKRGKKLSTIAVLCRLWVFARPVELALMSQQIPYRLAGGQSILDRKEIRPLIHLLEVMAGSYFNKARSARAVMLFDILAVPSMKTQHRVLEQIAQRWAESDVPLSTSLSISLPSDLKSYQERYLSDLIKALKEVENETLSCSERLARYCHKLNYRERLVDDALSQQAGDEQAGSVTEFIRFIKSLKDFSPQDILGKLEEMKSVAKTNSADCVTITTMHRSKGLEWPIVFLPGLSQAQIPYSGQKEVNVSPGSIESERRLMYVAMTRAKDQLFMTSPPKPQRSRPTLEETPSIFIKEMNLEVAESIGEAIENESLDKNLVFECVVPEVTKKYIQTIGSNIQLEGKIEEIKKVGGNIEVLKVGVRVNHTPLGAGTITNIGDNRIDIEFDDGSHRKFVTDLVRPHLS